MAAATLANMGMLAEARAGGGDRPRQGNDLFGAFGRDFTTRDGKGVMLVAITPRQWTGVLKVLGIAEAVSALEAELGVSFAADEGVRYDHRARLFPLFEQAFARQDLADLAPAFDANGVCWGPYQTLHQALDDPRLFAGNPIFAETLHPSGERYAAAGFAATIPQDARAPARAAARLGEHTDEVLADLLSLSSGEIARLHDAGIVA